MKNIELVELLCHNNNLELNFIIFVNLKRVSIDIDIFLSEEIRKQIPVWTGKREDFIIIVSLSKKTPYNMLK